MDPRHPQPLTPAAHLVLFQQRIEPSLERPDPRQLLNLSLIVERAFRRPDRLSDHLPRFMQIPRDRLDRLPTRILIGRAHVLSPVPYAPFFFLFLLLILTFFSFFFFFF